MTGIEPKDRVETIELLSLPDDEAVKWLRDNAVTEPPAFFSESNQHKVLSFAFGRRESPRLRLAVARYGTNVNSLRRMFRSGTKSERLAILSNVSVGPNSESLFTRDRIVPAAEAIEILRNHNSTEFGVLASNPNMDRDWLGDTIKKWVEIDGLTDEGLLMLVHYLSSNPIIEAKYDDTWMDGYAEHSFQRLNFALADLVQTVPVTTAWASVLGNMLAKLHLPFVPDYYVDLLERWQDPEPRDEGERDLFPFVREQIARYIVVRDHRPEAKGRLSLDHPDAAVRKALYSTLRPYELFAGIRLGDDFDYPIFEYLDDANKAQRAVADVCQECFDKDKNEFVEGLLWNEHFWRRARERRFLSDISWNLAEDPNHYMDVPNLYRSREAYYAEHNPAYFDDDDDFEAPEEDTVEGKVDYIQSEVRQMRQETSSKDDAFSLATQLAAIEARVGRLTGLIWALLIGAALIYWRLS